MERNSGLSDSSVSDLFFDGNFRGFFEDGPSKVYFTERVVFARKTRLHVLNWSRHRLKLSS